MVAHFLQSVTQRLVLGGELVYHRRPGEEGAILTLAGKYSGTEPSETVVRGSDYGLFWGSLPMSTTVTVFSLCTFSPSSTLGSYVECWVRWGPCKLLPQGK